MSRATAQSAVNDFSPLERRLLNDFQHEFPLSPTPFADIAAELGVTEDEVMATLESLKARGFISRVGPVFRPNRVGASTLAAMAVPAERLEAVAALVNGYAEVNHNYERDHRFNLWFVATARDEARLQRVLEEIAERTGIEVMPLPLLDDYFIDLGFDLQWT